MTPEVSPAPPCVQIGPFASHGQGRLVDDVSIDLTSHLTRQDIFGLFDLAPT